MATKLTSIETKEISLVRKGANRKRFSLTKGEEVMTEKDTQETVADTAKEALEKAEADLAAVKAKLAEVEKAAKEAADEAVKVSEAKDALEKAQKDALEKAAAEKAELEKALATEKEAKEVTEAISKAAADFKNLPAKADKLGPALRALKKADSKSAEEIESLLKSVDAMLAQTLDPKGTSAGTEEPSAWGKIEKAAAEITKADPKVTHAQAIDRVLQSNPALYQEHQSKR